MTALLLIAAITLRGDLDTLTEFIRLPDSYSPKYMEDIPGSDEFYDALYYDADRTWSVYTNGILTTMTNASLGPVVLRNLTQVHSPYCLYYDLNGVYATLGWTPTLTDRYEPWKPAKFDMHRVGMTDGKIVNARIVSNGDGDKQSLYELLGENIYQPRSYQLNDNTAAALLSTYAAYFERLYYASQGYSNDWDEEVWGAAAACDEFPFNLTNDEYSAVCYFDLTAASTNGYRTIPNVRKIIGRPEIAALQTNVLAMLTSEPTFHKADKIVHPALVYRPGWIADLSEMPDEAYDDESRLWWASQEDPPKIDIERAPGTTFSQEPSRYGFGLMPQFGWTDEPVAVRSGTEFVKTHDWATRCVTLTAAAADYPTHPIERLFHALGYDYAGGVKVSDFVQPYHFSENGRNQYSLFEYMTNVWTKCVAQYADKDDAFANYVRTAYAAVREPSAMRRIRANDYVGVNHVLGSMNRSYHLPVMRLDCTNRVWEIARRARYEGDETDVVAWLTTNELEEVVYKTESEGTCLSLRQVGDAKTVVTNYLRDARTRKVELHVSTIATSGTNETVQAQTTKKISLNDESLAKMCEGIFDRGRYKWTLLSVGKVPVPNIWFSEQLKLTFRDETGEEFPVYYYKQPDPIEFRITPKTSMWRSYDFERMDVCVPIVSQVQPGADATVAGIVKEAVSSFLMVRDIDCGTTTAKEFKSVNETYTSGDVVAKAESQAWQMLESFNSNARSFHEGRSYDEYDNFAAIPGNVSVSGCIDEFKLRNVTLQANKPQNTTSVTNVTYDAWFEVTNETVDASIWVTNRIEWMYIYDDIHEFGIKPDGTWITGPSYEYVKDFRPIGDSSETNVEHHVETEIVEVGPLHFETGNDHFTVTNSIISNFWVTTESFSVTNKAHDVYHFLRYLDESGTEVSNRYEKVHDYVEVVESHDGSDSYTYQTYDDRPRIVGLEDATRVTTNMTIRTEQGDLMVEFDYDHDSSGVGTAEILKAWWCYPSVTNEIEATEYSWSIGTWSMTLENASTNVNFGTIWSPEHEIDCEGDMRILNRVDWNWKQLKLNGN